MVVDNTVQWLQLNLKETGLPVGFEYFTMNPNIPAGSLPLQGGLYSRLAYPDLWEWVQKQTGYLKAESEWQELAANNSGNVPFYSKGDGTTTFRVPALKCWVRGAGSINEVGGYLAAGLPNIIGSTAWAVNGILGTYSGQTTPYHQNTGALSVKKDGKAYGAIGSTGEDSAKSNVSVNIDASLSNPIYGSSDTVQPKSIVGMWLVKAYGTVTNVGSTDVAAIAQGLTRVENKLNEAAIVGTIIPYAGASLPTGYLPCNGAAISRETYTSLFAVIGETYGSGNGSTTFNLPNLTDKFIQGSDTVGTVKNAGLPNATGYTLLYGHKTEVTSGGALSITSISNLSYGFTSTTTNDFAYNFKQVNLNLQKSNSIYGNSTTVQPPALTMRYIIKY